MSATEGEIEKASRLGLDGRDVRALTQYLTVVEDVGRARGADGLYLVVSQSGREYLVDAAGRSCECDDHQFRGGECKHLRRVDFATGRRAIPVAAAVELDVDPTLGDHVDGEVRYLATDGGERSFGSRTSSDLRSDGGEPREIPASEASRGSGDVRSEPDAGSWTIRDRGRGRERQFDTRSEAEAALDDLEDLGLDVELVPPSPDGEDEDAEREADRDGDDDDPEPPANVHPDEYDLDGRTVAVDPLTWLPDEFVDWIDGTPAINRKGFEVLGHFYDVDVETDVQVGPAETDFEYCQVKATAVTADGRRCEALGSARVDRGDDPNVLLELADTRARKRALSIATGVGVVAVEELTNEVAGS